MFSLGSIAKEGRMIEGTVTLKINFDMLYVQEVLTNPYSDLQYKTGQDFLDRCSSM